MKIISKSIMELLLMTVLILDLQKLILSLLILSCSLSFSLTFSVQLHFEVPLSPVIAAKKARPSDGGSDEVCDECLICWDVDSFVWSKKALDQQSLKDVIHLWERMDCTTLHLE